LHYPAVNPIAFQLGPIEVHWYGMMYLFGFVVAWLLALYRAKKPWNHFTREQINDLIFYAALGVILGGRFGYTFFYNFSSFIANPFILFKIWQGGMSFHGGLLGVGAATWLYARKIKRPWTEVIDFVAPLVPLGLCAGRIGNFINGELWGRITTLPWGMLYPNAGSLPRHPSELYEAFLEGLVLFLILWFFSSKPRPRFAISLLFLLCYGVMRFLVEFVREPDPQWGFIAWNWLTMGQLLSIPMILAGIIGLGIIYHKEKLYEHF